MLLCAPPNTAAAADDDDDDDDEEEEEEEEEEEDTASLCTWNLILITSKGATVVLATAPAHAPASASRHFPSGLFAVSFALVPIPPFSLTAFAETQDALPLPQKTGRRDENLTEIFKLIFEIFKLIFSSKF